MEKHAQIWVTPMGERVTCTEKLKVMQQNIDELHSCAQEAFEDGILMDIDPKQLQDYFMQMMQNLTNPYKDQGEDHSYV